MSVSQPMTNISSKKTEDAYVENHHPIPTIFQTPGLSVPTAVHLPGTVDQSFFETPCLHVLATDATIHASLTGQESLSPSTPQNCDRHTSIHCAVDPVSGATPAFEHMRRRLASAYFVYFVCGWAEGVTGTILPYFKADFHLTYMTSSILFAISTVGFTIGTLLIEPILRSLSLFYLASTERSFVPAIPFLRRVAQPTSPRQNQGLGHSASQGRFFALILASLFHASYFAIMGSKRGFSTSLVGYAIAAFARAILTATLNAYVASTPKKSLGYALGCLSVGSLCAPFVCQTVMAAGVPWPHFYFGSLVLSALNTSFLVIAFRPTKNEFRRERHAALEVAKERLLTTSNRTSTTVSFDSPRDGEKSVSSSVILIDAPPPKNNLRRALATPYQWAFQLFTWVYSGSETATQGFMVTYLLGVRHANPKTVGYVTSGFWGGMAVGRFTWGYFSPRLTFSQRKHVIHICIAVALTMHLLIWFVRSTVENAISTAVVGLVYSPIFPGVLSLANEVFPPEAHLVSMAMISAFASFGGALFPFITGTLLNFKGPQALTYVTVAQATTMFCLWSLFPSKKPSRMSVAAQV